MSDSRAGNTTVSGRLLGDRYELIRRIGTGGMAEVWEASDRSLGRRVAIKLLHHHLAEDSSVLARFRSEAQAAARLTHPGVVSIYDTVTTAQTDAIVMELVEGQDLRTVLDARGTLVLDDAIEVAIQVAQALGHAHQHGIVHRDVKPANILVRPDRRVKLSDFGIAKALDDSTFTEAGSLVGTIKYLAPEQIQGHPVDGRTDLYSLSTVLYEMLCGEVPFSAQDLASSMDRVRRPAPRARTKRPDLPEAVDEFLAAGLARDPNDRPADANSYAASLIALRRPSAASGPAAPTPSAPTPLTVPTPAPKVPKSIPMRTPEPPPARVTKTRRRSRLEMVWPLIAALLMIAALVTVWLLLRPARDSVGDRLGSGSSDSSTTVVNSTDPSAASSTTATDPPATTTTVTTTTTTIAFTDGARVIGFDPLGDGDEHADAVGRAADGDPGTFWNTHSWTTREFGGTKSGTGLIIEFEEPTALTAFVATTNNNGWAAQVYEADSAPNVLENWDEPIAEFSDLPDQVELPLPNITTSAVLVWFTDLGDGELPIRLEVYELTVSR